MIRVENLRHSYGQDEHYQVDNISFEVAEGEIFGFLGPNGAGKSTTQKILTGLLPLQQGRAEIAGVDVRQTSRRIFNEIGVAFEQPNLYKKLTGRENLQFYAGLFDVPTVEPMALLSRFELEEAANKRVGEYSKGMQQRLMLARSLLNNPRIWFLDEPTSGLDPQSARAVRALILEKKADGVTIFLTTHDMHVAETLADRVGFINQGRIVALDTPRALKLAHGDRNLRVEYRRNGTVEAVQLRQTEPADRRQLLALLEGGEVETVHSQEATLENIFIALTGRSLGGEEV
jgi:fluoroquinolone transport system ATP-binding protein